MKSDLLYGYHSVREALLANRRECHILWILDSKAGARSPNQLMDLARSRGAKIRETSAGVFSRLQETGVRHQGIAMETSHWRSSTLDQIWNKTDSTAESPLLVVLDHIQDPQNLGAILRNCDACGVHGAICAKRRAAPLSPAVSHASAGAMEHLPVAQVANLRQTMERLREQGVWLGGLDSTSTAAAPIGDFDLDRPLALVVGREGAGLTRLVRDGCDFLLKIEMWGRVESMNAASAVGIALYLARRARSGKG